ncbi:hypothetical protein B296_00017391 [Ensete ventricosum]|uniref:Uncharacterized protein n=1 Tax=Ensete ventricosum TaxID=4639 RepID=A0A426ZP37_ENSVE|nr:hypothetical protein B296_00017391 [Ensete ventricosum]
MRRKAYAQAVVKKCPRQTNELQIAFEAGDVEYLDHDDVLVISICIANVQVKRVMVETDSSVDVLYHDAFLKLGLTATDLTPMSSTLTRFTGDSITPLRTTLLLVTLRQEPRSKTMIGAEREKGYGTIAIGNNDNNWKMRVVAGCGDSNGDTINKGGGRVIGD